MTANNTPNTPNTQGLRGPDTTVGARTALAARLRREPWSVASADHIAELAHREQVDKVGRDYIEHPRTVAAMVQPYGEQVVQVALLHDVVEDSDWTLADLAAAGAPADVIAGVDAMTKRTGERRADAIHRAGKDPLARIVKAADNAHNSDPARVARIQDVATRERLQRKYAEDRAILDHYQAPRFDPMI